jgi:MATE family multidrug resistance protein
MILCRKVWGYCYSSEKEVVNYAGEMLIYVAVSHFVDGPQSVLSGFSITTYSSDLLQA